MVNEIVSLISLSDLLLLVYRYARDFCALIFYPAPLPNSLISSSSFLVASLALSMHSIMSSANSDSSTSSFPIRIPFISFSYLIAMARASKTMLNNSGKVDIIVLFLSWRKWFLCFTIEDGVGCGFVIYGLYYFVESSLYAYFLERLS